MRLLQRRGLVTTKIRQLYAIKNDAPTSLAVFIVYLVPKDTMIATPIRVVQRDRKSVISINNGAIFTMGTQAFYDPLDAVELMVHARQQQIQQAEDSLAEIEEFRQRIIKAKEAEKHAK
jgi:hypothetical protein